MKKSTYLIPTDCNIFSPIEYRYDKRKKTCELVFVKDIKNMKQPIVF